MKKQILFGTGSGAEKLLLNFNITFSYSVDNNPSKWGGRFNGLEVWSPEVLANEEKENLQIWIASSSYIDIAKQLEILGFEEGKNFINGLNYVNYWKVVESTKQNMEELLNLNSPFSMTDLINRTDLSDLLPPYERTLQVMKSLLKILANDFRHFQGSYEWNCIDKDGDFIPWYTYPAIEYLKQFDFSDKTIFEYGSGNSTLFWGSRSKTANSVENDKSWFDKISSVKLENTTIDFKDSPEEYINLINRFPYKFDVIIIDGDYRKECAQEAIKKLNRGGLIILDNSDRESYSDITALLRNSDLIQVDMAGFGPINGYAWTTSLFFHRQFNLKPIRDIQPHHCIGGLGV